MPIIDDLKGKSIQVDNREVLDQVMNLIDCYTRPEADDLIVDTIHLEEADIMDEFQQITGIDTDTIISNQLLVLWR